MTDYNVSELGLHDGDELAVADQTTPSALTFVLSITAPKMDFDVTIP